MGGKAFSEEELTKAEEYYKTGLSLCVVAEELERSESGLRGRLKSRGITFRKDTGRPRVYQVDEDFFNIIDSEEKAYWLGFLTADGWITDDGVHLCLNKKDVDHIKKFKRSLKSTHRVIERERVNAYGIAITSRKLKRALEALGLTKQKSKTIMPAKVNRKIEQDYWRGMFDGDGCISISKVGTPTVSLVGTKAVCEGFRQFLLNRNVKTKAKVRQKAENLFAFQTGGRLIASAILSVLYNGSTIHLDRKKQLAKKVNR